MRKSNWSVKLENFQADFPSFQFLIEKRERIKDGLTHKEFDMVHRFHNAYHVLAEEAEEVICMPESFLAEVIRQQSDDIAIGVWRWWYNRRPIKILLEIEIIIGIYFRIYPGRDLFSKILFVEEDVLSVSDSNIGYIKNFIREKFPFLEKMEKPFSPESWDRLMNSKGIRGAIYELHFEWPSSYR